MILVWLTSQLMFQPLHDDFYSSHAPPHTGTKLIATTEAVGHCAPHALSKITVKMTLGSFASNVATYRSARSFQPALYRLLRHWQVGA